MNNLVQEIVAAAAETPRIFFAPIIGAFKGPAFISRHPSQVAHLRTTDMSGKPHRPAL